MIHEVNSKGHRPGKHRLGIRGVKHGFYVSGLGSADRIVFLRPSQYEVSSSFLIRCCCLLSSISSSLSVNSTID